MVLWFLWFYGGVVGEDVRDGLGDDVGIVDLALSLVELAPGEEEVVQIDLTWVKKRRIMPFKPGKLERTYLDDPESDPDLVLELGGEAVPLEAVLEDLGGLLLAPHAGNHPNPVVAQLEHLILADDGLQEDPGLEPLGRVLLQLEDALPGNNLWSERAPKMSRVL